MIFIDLSLLRSLYCKISYFLAEEHWSHTNLGIWQPTYDSVCKDNSWVHGKCRQRFFSNVYKRFFFFTFFTFFNVFFYFHLNVYSIYAVRDVCIDALRRRERRSVCFHRTLQAPRRCPFHGNVPEPAQTRPACRRWRITANDNCRRRPTTLRDLALKHCAWRRPLARNFVVFSPFTHISVLIGSADSRAE